MRNDVLTIIKTLIEIGNQYESDSVCDGLSIIKDSWPSLTGEEKKEIAVVIEAYKKVALEGDEEETDYTDQNTPTKRNMDFEDEPKGLFRKFKKKN